MASLEVLMNLHTLEFKLIVKTSDEIRKTVQAENRCYYANKKLISNKILNYNSKIQIYKTIIRPTVTYGSETWVLTASDKNQLNIFERNI